MDRRYTISQLARAAGVPTSTLRYYERVGLVQPIGRAENNYRLYTQDTLQIVRFIRIAQAFSAPLAWWLMDRSRFRYAYIIGFYGMIPTDPGGLSRYVTVVGQSRVFVSFPPTAG